MRWKYWIGGFKYLTDIKQNCSKTLTTAGAHYPERATFPFSCNGVFTSRAIFRYASPAKITVSGCVPHRNVSKNDGGETLLFLLLYSVFHLSFFIIPIHHSLNWSSHNSMRFICTFHMCKWSNGIPLIQFSVCEFYRLNPRFVSFSRAFAMVKEKMQRSDLKYLKLITGKGWSKNKPTCDTVWKLHAPGNGLLPLIWFGSLNDGTLLLPKWNRLENFPFLAL